MAIHQQRKQSDLEKRLQLLRRQVYGKSDRPSYQTNRQVDNLKNSPAQSHNNSATSDLSYFHQDLIKILTFSALAVGAQITLFFLLKTDILNIKLF